MTRRWTIDRDVDMPMRDGVVLRADVWRVDDDAARPVVLFRTPYDKTTMSLDTLRPAQCLEGDYHVVVQDTRGRFASEGDWAPLMWAQEATDTYDTIEWIGAQPWCDDSVVMAGTSYLGIMQWLGAAERPPHLRAIAPAMTTSLELDIAETGGAFRLDQIFSWLGFMASDWLQRQVHAGAAIDATTMERVVALVRDPSAAMNDLPLGRSLSDIPSFPVDIGSVLAREISHVPEFDCRAIEVPTLSIGGWFDVFCRATVQQFKRLRAAGGGGPEVRATHRLVMGPWTHGGTLPHYQGELNFGVLAGALAARLSDRHLAFFDRHVREDASDGPAVEYFLCGADEWRTAEDWPPPESVPHRWFLRGAGTAAGDDGATLDREPPGIDELPDRYLYDPADPAPTHGGRVLYLGRLVGGPFDQRHLETRGDVLRYTSAPLDAPVDIAGAVTATLFVASTAPDTDFVAKLCDVYPDGRSILVCDGALRARYRCGFDREVPLVPDEITRIEIDLGDIGWRVQAGHRLRLLVTSSNFPQLDRNLNTANPIGADSRGVPATQTIAHTSAYPSHILVPVLTEP